MSIELVYIGEELPLVAPAFIRAFQDKKTGLQYDWSEVQNLILGGAVTVRHATEEEFAAAEAATGLVKAACVFLMNLQASVVTTATEEA